VAHGVCDGWCAIVEVDSSSQWSSWPRGCGCHSVVTHVRAACPCIESPGVFVTALRMLPHSSSSDSARHTPYHSLDDPAAAHLQHRATVVKPMASARLLSSDDADRASGESLRSAFVAPFRLGSFLRERVPALSWLPNYAPRRHLAGDLIAGLTVGLMVIPQGLSYASVAGTPPIYGLYSAFIGVFVYSCFGGCKDISVGPTAILSLLSFQANGGDIDVAIQMTMLSGIVQMVVAIARLGLFVDFISGPVLSGFTSAAAIQIILTQVGHVCGYKTRDQVYFAVYDFFHDIGQLRWADLLLGVGCMVLLHLMSKLKSRFPNSVVLTQLCIGRNAFIVLVTALLSFIISRSHAVPWKLVGSVPSGLPTPELPQPSGSMIKDQAGNIALSALVGFLESIAIAKAFAQQNGYAHKLSANQELFAVGLANFLGSFFRALPVTGSFSRTAVASQAGAKTQLQGVFTGIVVLLALVLLTPAFYYIPTTVLSAVVIVSVIHTSLPYAHLLLLIVCSCLCSCCCLVHVTVLHLILSTCQSAAISGVCRSSVVSIWPRC
jgi:high affinity sulfate transporter 1